VTLLLGLFLSILAPRLASASGAADQVRTNNFSYDGVARVQVLNAEIYSIEVSGTSEQGLTAEVRAPSDTRVGIEHRRSGDTVMIRSFRTSRLFGWLGPEAGTHRLILRVPRSCELEITTATGSITVADVSGAKKLQSDTGSITLRGCEGNTVATTETGSQTYSALRGDLSARVETGSINLTDVEGAMSVETATGGIQAISLRLTDDSSFTAQTGSITLELTQSLEDFSFQLRSDTGSIVVGGTQARGRLVVGGGRIRLQAETDTGGVRIQGQ
jgi:hypothetical protein